MKSIPSKSLGGSGKYFFVVCLLFNSLSAQTDVIARQLADTEHEFSLEAKSKGIRVAFLEYFDDDCIVFAPHPTNGKKAYASDSDSLSSLEWKPSVVEVSSSGDFGYTTGPSEYREGNSHPDSAHYGHFVSIWKKNSHGDWKVILDFGIGYPKREVREEQSRNRRLASSKTGVTQKAACQLTWHAADSAYSEMSRENGSKAAIQMFGSEDVRIYRKGKFPAEGLEAGARFVDRENFSKFQYSAGEISAAGDLGYTYGLAMTAATDTCNYIRVWRLDGDWKLVIDIVKPWGRVN